MQLGAKGFHGGAWSARPQGESQNFFHRAFPKEEGRKNILRTPKPGRGRVKAMGILHQGGGSHRSPVKGEENLYRELQRTPSKGGWLDENFVG